MKNSKLLILLTFLLVIQSCSMLDYRDYENEMSYTYEEPLFAANKDFMIVAGDSGRQYHTQEERGLRTPASAGDKLEMRYLKSLEKELVQLENRMDPSEYEEYQEYEHKLGDTSQKIYFLGLSSSERDEYLRVRKIKNDFVRTRGIASVENKRSRYPQVNDIMLGMSKNDVVQNWGLPDKEDIAGDPRLENERWAYRRSDSTKYIYFEAGVVEGWSER